MELSSILSFFKQPLPVGFVALLMSQVYLVTDFNHLKKDIKEVKVEISHLNERFDHLNERF